MLSNPTATDKAVLQRYLNIPQPEDKFLATYIWIDGSGENLRSKTMTVGFEPKAPAELPWVRGSGSRARLSFLGLNLVFGLVELRRIEHGPSRGLQLRRLSEAGGDLQ
jgi:hypothetical protein